jgi:DNA ligase-1
VRFHELVDVSNSVAQTRGRLEKTAKLADLVKRLEPGEIGTGVAYLCGSLTQGRVGVGWSALSQARSTPPSSIASLDLKDVEYAFGQISAATGAGSAKRRASVLTDLFRRATEAEQDFLVRLLSGDLRQGALEGVLSEAVAKAAGADPGLVRHAAMMCGDLAETARVVLTTGSDALSAYTIQLLRPVQPMLASPAENVTEALAAFGEAAFELKLDGARIQVHKAGDVVKVFSRALRDVTTAVPEVVDAVRSLPARDLILDGEVIALRPDGIARPFQETMRRFGRRLDVELLRKELPLTPFFFDCLYVDGRPLISEPQRSRFASLEKVAGTLAIPHRIIADARTALDFFNQAIAGGHEGLMAKSLEAPYAAGSRGSAWLKIKQVRTLDLVVLAAEWGSGRRRGWLSNLHLGARDDVEPGRFIMLGKTFKGMTDELLNWQTAALLEREVRREGHIVFVRPELVVEIAFNDLQASSQYPGGLALRFARVKGYRADKRAGEADTLRTLQEIYRSMTGLEPPAPWSDVPN